MNPQTFRAPDILSALNIVQTKLGPDALVLSVREVQDGPAWKVWQQAQIEVMAVKSESGAAQTASPQKKQVHSPPIPNPESFADLWKSLPVNQEKEPRSTPVHNSLSTPLMTAKKTLQYQGLDEELMTKIITTCQQTLNPSALEDDHRVKKHLIGQIAASLRTVNKSKIGASKVICLLGSSGAGKTSTIAKLVTYFKASEERQVIWVCADTVRAGAIAEARAYTESLNIPLTCAFGPNDIEDAYVEVRESESLMLVDMPNTNPYREPDLIIIGEYLSVMPIRETYIVAPSTTKDVDLQQLIAALSSFDVNGLVITKLDESETVGSAVNAVWRNRLPIAFYTSGPQVIDELVHARPNHLVERLFN